MIKMHHEGACGLYRNCESSLAALRNEIRYNVLSANKYHHRRYALQ